MSKLIVQCSIEEIEQRLRHGEIILPGRDDVTVFSKTANGYRYEQRPLSGVVSLVIEVPTLTQILLLLVFGASATLDPVTVEAGGETTPLVERKRIAAERVVIAVYPSIFFPDRASVEDMARRAPGMPRLDDGMPTEVATAWVEGDEHAGKVYATLAERTGPNMLTLEYLKMRELEEQGIAVETVMDCSFRRLL